VLKTLEDEGLAVGRLSCAQDGGQESRPTAHNAHKQDSDQLSLLDMGGSEIAAILNSTDLNTLTPLEALSLLFEMKKML
jgi:hypothetical protein